MLVVKSVIDYSDAVFSGKTFCLYTTFSFLPENTANGCCMSVRKPQRGGGMVMHLGSWTFASETSRPHLNKHVFII